MIQVICCSSILTAPGRAGAFSRDFTTILAPGCRAFSGALKIETLKAPQIPGPERAVHTNDWCITVQIFCYCFERPCHFGTVSYNLTTLFMGRL